MARKSKPKANKTKDEIAKNLQASMLKTSPADNLQRNMEFAGQMSTSIGSIIENLSVQNEVDFSDEQKKIFQDMLNALKKMATSQGDTTKDREELRTMFAKMVVQTEKQTEKVEKDIVVNEKEVESKEEEVRYLKYWQEKAQEDKTVTEKEKEEIKRDLEARVVELTTLKKDKERLTKSLETQKKLSEEIQNKMQEPEEKRLTMMDAIKGDTTAALRKFAPGLSWNPEEGQSYKDMLTGNLKKVTTGKGFMQAFGSVLLEPDKKAPSNAQLIESEREAMRQQEELQGLMGRMEQGSVNPETTSDMADAIGDATENASEDSAVLVTLQSLLQEVSVIRGIVEGSLQRDKGGKYRDTDTGQYISKETARTSGRGLFSKDELNQQLGLSSSELKKTSIKELEQMAAEEGRISPIERTAESIAAPTELLSALEEQGKVQSNILSALEKIADNTGTSAKIDKERDSEEDSGQSTLTNEEVKGQVEAVQSAKVGSAEAQQVASAEQQSGGGGMGQMIMDRLGGRMLSKTKGLGGSLMRGSSRLMSKGGSLLSRAAPLASRVAGGLGARAAGKVGAKALGKSLLKKIPGIGLVAGLGFGASRLLSGDWKGALGEVASGAASTVPGIGTAASAAIDAGLAARDMSNASIEGAPGDTAGMVSTATENSIPAMVAPTGGGGSTVVTNVSGGGGGAPAIGPTEIRIQDNSFVRFQDKRVARV
jgi:hypothetical protein